jgi:hypothetical protein
VNYGRHHLNRAHARAILNYCAVSLSNITKTPVPPFPIPDCLDGNEGHPARRFASACGAAGSHFGALMDGNEITGAAPRKAEGGLHTLLAGHCAGAAPVLINSLHNGEIADA